MITLSQLKKDSNALSQLRYPDLYMGLAMSLMSGINLAGLAQGGHHNQDLLIQMQQMRQQMRQQVQRNSAHGASTQASFSGCQPHGVHGSLDVYPDGFPSPAYPGSADAGIYGGMTAYPGMKPEQEGMV